MKTPIRISVFVFAFAAALTLLLIVFFSAKPAMKEGVEEETSVSMAEDKMAVGNKLVVPIRQAEPSQPEENPSGPRILLPDWYHEGSLVSTNEFTAPEPTHPAGLPMITSKSGLLDYAAGQAKQIRIIAAGITNDFPVNGASLNALRQSSEEVLRRFPGNDFQIINEDGLVVLNGKASGEHGTLELPEKVPIVVDGVSFVEYVLFDQVPGVSHRGFWEENGKYLQFPSGLSGTRTVLSVRVSGRMRNYDPRTGGEYKPPTRQ